MPDTMPDKVRSVDDMVADMESRRVTPASVSTAAAGASAFVSVSSYALQVILEQKDVVLIEGVLPPLRTHVKHCTTVETIVHPRMFATLI